LNHQGRGGAENRRADYHRRELQLKFEDAERQQIEGDHVDLEVRVDDVYHPQDHQRADDELRVLDKCGHRKAPPEGTMSKSLATEIAIVNAVQRSANDAAGLAAGNG
jgi:hypothetical protein